MYRAFTGFLLYFFYILYILYRMIYSIRGELYRKSKDKVLIRSSDGFVYEVLTSATVTHRIDEYMHGDIVELFIYQYIEMQQNRAFSVLIGFLTELEKDFFERILGVSGIGPKAAIKALSKPISEIAASIEQGDTAALKKLPGIGLQRAKNIVAVLQGKLSQFMLLKDQVEQELVDESFSTELFEEAEIVLLQLQYKKKEAQDMIKKALKANPEIKDLEALLAEVYKQYKPF